MPAFMTPGRPSSPGRYWMFALAGMLVCGASIVSIDWALYHLIRTGTCASGGPYVSARPCPPGTGGHIMALIGGIFGGLIGTAVFAARGAGDRKPARIGLPLAMWSLLFCTMAASALLGAFGPAADDRSDSKTAAVILGIIFFPMGLAPLPFAGKRGPRMATGISLGDPDAREKMREALAVAHEAARTASAGSAQGASAASAQPRTPADPATRLEKLTELRTRGLITDEEFEAKRKELLDEI